MTTTTHTPDGSVSTCCAPRSAIEDIRAHEVPPEVASARAAGFRLLLERGTPVELSDWAAASGMSDTALQEVLDRANVNGRVERDVKGRLLGIAGLTVEPTRHEITLDGTSRWTWCALDAIGILGALEVDGTVHSTDPHTGTPIRVDFHAGQPDGDAALFILDGYDGGNVKDDWCPLVNFFATAHAAETWASDQELKGDVVTVRQVADEAAAMWRSVTDPSAPQAC